VAEIYSLDLKFDRIEEEIEYLKTVTKEEIVEVFQTGITNNKQLLITAVEGNLPESTEGYKDEIYEESIPQDGDFSDCIAITNTAEFRSANKFIGRS